MTYTTNKKFLVAILAVGIISGAMVLSQNVDAMSTKGKDIITNEMKTIEFPGQERIQEISVRLNADDITDTEKTQLTQEIEQITENARKSSPEMPSELKTKLQDKQSLLSDVMAQKYAALSSAEIRNDLPIVGIMADRQSQSLLVHIDSYEFSPEKAPAILDKIRAIVGTEIDVTIQPMEPMRPHCSQTSDCEPAQGGVKIEAGFFAPCSTGFKASYDGKTGFVTAGHCGNLNDGVGQPTYAWWNDIGTIHDKNQGGSCDCAFVDANESISDKIYNNINPTFAANAAYLDYVNMEGHVTKGKSGSVLNASWSGSIGGIWYTDMAYANYVGSGGDSGAPVYESISGTSLSGIHSGGNSVGSVFTHQSNIKSEFSGLNWTFT